MDLRAARILVFAMAAPLAIATCSSDSPQRPSESEAAAPAEPPVEAPVEAAAVAGVLPSVTGCATGARCLRVTQLGRPSTQGTFMAQCRGRFADFIVPRTTLPNGYAGPWFMPAQLEDAATGVPSTTRPWTASSVDPRQEPKRLAYALTLRNYAFASAPVRALTPTLTNDADYFDSAGRTIAPTLRSQAWYPAPRMFYGNTNAPGTREAAYGMTLERRVLKGELAGNLNAFVNYAVAYYDARGARVFQQMWDTSVAGVDTPRRDRMQFTQGSFVYKLLFSAAKASDFPSGQDPLAGALQVNVMPNSDGNAVGTAVPVRLLQIDIAVKDTRAGVTGWYFLTYVHDKALPGTSPWRKMAPLGLTWGNDPDGTTVTHSWINPAAPAYARAHITKNHPELRLNGPVDNPESACMSCHATAQAPSVAKMLPDGSCSALRAKWYRNLAGNEPFGQFDPNLPACEKTPPSINITAADYSLQMASTVSRALTGVRTFNPCTWDEANPPPVSAVPELPTSARVFEVTR
jgi:hypothetical protein